MLFSGKRTQRETGEGPGWPSQVLRPGPRRPPVLKAQRNSRKWGSAVMNVTHLSHLPPDSNALPPLVPSRTSSPFPFSVLPAPSLQTDSAPHRHLGSPSPGVRAGAHFRRPEARHQPAPVPARCPGAPGIPAPEDCSGRRSATSLPGPGCSAPPCRSRASTR